MNPLELPDALQQALGAFEGFRKLGFSADNIFIIINGPMQLQQGPETCHQILMSLRAQDKEFKVDCGIVPDTEKRDIGDLWMDVCEAMNNETIDRDALDKVWQKSLAHRDSASFVAALVRKGFIIPKGQN